MGNTSSKAARRLRNVSAEGQKEALKNVKSLAMDQNKVIKPTQKTVQQQETIQRQNENVPLKNPEKKPDFVSRAMSLGVVEVNETRTKIDPNHASLRQLKNRSRIQNEFEASKASASNASNEGHRHFPGVIPESDGEAHGSNKSEFVNPTNLTEMLQFYKDSTKQDKKIDERTISEQISNKFNLDMRTVQNLVSLLSQQSIRLPHLKAVVPNVTATSVLEDSFRGDDKQEKPKKITIVDMDDPVNKQNEKADETAVSTASG